MKEIPILFSTPMVQAILAGRKTMTRRVLKLKHYHDHNWMPTPIKEEHVSGRTYWEMRCGTQYTLPIFKCPYGQPGDLLWVRESWQHWLSDKMEPTGHYFYKSSDEGHNGIGWKPSIHMPKTAARIWLEVTNVQAERLQDITEHDAIQEGMSIRYDKDEDGLVVKDKRNTEAFEELWQSINGPESWEANPWVWVVEFKVLSTTGKP